MRHVSSSATAGYYYNGHRGYRDKRPGYRYHNGWWFPAGAFIAGAIIGNAINGSTSARPASSAHVDWCYNRYRSYRASDNTFQPYNGPRQQCYSPYS
ncbi:BA14K family protein [Mesorhizobium sp. J428]|uniref:BA14K family protein n=1 Tax=Mesorhizobium sp. J428 TaxID=2898440 RepID=UPI0035AFDC47